MPRRDDLRLMQKMHSYVFYLSGEGVRFDHEAGSMEHYNVTESQKEHSGG